MPVWKIAAATVVLSLLLVGCGRQDAQAALEAAAKSLQTSMEDKDIREMMSLIHPQFTANEGLDRDWAKRTATLMFLRHRNVQVIALNNRSWVDPTYPDKGYSEAQVALTGAEGLLPQRVGHYSIQLEWWRTDGEWQLARLRWE